MRENVLFSGLGMLYVASYPYRVPSLAMSEHVPAAISKK